jgi:hypothetical protein
MPAGLPYFAWIDASETVFGGEHLRWDEQVFSFTLTQDEGDPASLTVVIRRPRNVAGAPIGLLGPGRKIWAWFALDCGPALVKFRGRLVGIPTSLFEDLVTLEFVARPVDVVAQKEALADTLRVLPFYDEAVIDPQRRKDPDVVLEGYTKIWHYDRETHVVTVSDEITGEDGIVDFDGVSEDGKVLYDGLGLTLASGPLARVDIAAEYTWTQQARGTVDLTSYLLSHWPGVIVGEGPGPIIPGLTESNWPKSGAGLGDGWQVAASTAKDVFPFQSFTTSYGLTLIAEESGGEGTTQVTFNETRSGTTGGIVPSVSTESITEGVIDRNEWSVNYDDDGDASSWSRSYSSHGTTINLQGIQATLSAGYTAERPFTERISFSLFADVQPILTDPEDGEALRIDDIRSVNLSSGEELAPIIDPRRRSYIATERGNQSLEHLIAFARAHLMKRARVVEIAFAPKLARMPEITLRKSAILVEPRVGEALGKVIGYSIALDGSDGRINCEARIGCTIGRGGLATASDGAPAYATADYVGYDYQQFIGRIVLVDTSVGYHPPDAAPNDDGINFLSTLSPNDVIEQDLVVTMGANPKLGDVNSNFDVHATFKLKSMTREFSSDYEIQVTDLKIPAGYNLEAT